MNELASYWLWLTACVQQHKLRGLSLTSTQLIMLRPAAAMGSLQIDSDVERDIRWSSDSSVR